jgi:hypothetical protein
MVREVVEAAIGKVNPSPTFVLYSLQKEADGQIFLADESGTKKINDTDRAPIIFCVCDEDDITKRWDELLLRPLATYSVEHCFLLFMTQDDGSLWSTEKLRQTRVLMTHPPQQGLAIVNVDGVVELKFAPDGHHSVEAIPIVREALLKVFPPPPPQGKEGSKDEKEEKTRTGRPYILLVVITLVILLGLIGGVVYMVS